MTSIGSLHTQGLVLQVQNGRNLSRASCCTICCWNWLRRLCSCLRREGFEGRNVSHRFCRQLLVRCSRAGVLPAGARRCDLPSVSCPAVACSACFADRNWRFIWHGFALQIQHRGPGLAILALAIDHQSWVCSSRSASCALQGSVNLSPVSVMS